MVSFVVVLFFALTGITLNHPEWMFGSSETTHTEVGVLPAAWRAGDEVDWLVVVEHIRREHRVRAGLGDHHADDLEGSLTFKAPGYSADVFFDRATGEYEISILQSGAVGVLNDLHRGRDAGRAWAWLIDLSGVLLGVVSLTGIGLLLYLKKYRRTALVTLGAGALVVLVVGVWAAWPPPPLRQALGAHRPIYPSGLQLVFHPHVGGHHVGPPHGGGGEQRGVPELFGGAAGIQGFAGVGVHGALVPHPDADPQLHEVHGAMVQRARLGRGSAELRVGRGQRGVALHELLELGRWFDHRAESEQGGSKVRRAPDRDRVARRVPARVRHTRAGHDESLERFVTGTGPGPRPPPSS
jgi:uncharacterized protein